MYLFMVAGIVRDGWVGGGGGEAVHLVYAQGVEAQGNNILAGL